MNVTVFEAINITKKYRNTLALNQVSMSVMQGDIYGFIGENGAGKTTMIRLLTGLAEPTTGKIALFGESNKKLAKQRERIGCIIESPSLYLDMTAYENLEVQRLQRGIPGKGCIDNALALVGLKDTGKKKAKDFSLGMRQRLALAIALLGNPEFLVLDEPINGLDPTGIIELRNLLKRLNKERGITILISSHILTELHQLANRYGTPRDHWDQPLRTLRLRDGAAGSRWFHRGPGHGIQSAHVMLLFHVSASRTMVASCVACSGRFPHIPGIHPILALAPASITPRYASPGKPTDGRLTSSRC